MQDIDEDTEVEYEVVIDSVREQYRYVLVADSPEQAEAEAKGSAYEDGWNGAGQIKVTALS